MYVRTDVFGTREGEFAVSGTLKKCDEEGYWVVREGQSGWMNGWREDKDRKGRTQ